MGSWVWALAGQLLHIHAESLEWLLHEAHPASGQRGRQRGARVWPQMVYRTAAPPVMDEYQRVFWPEFQPERELSCSHL